MISKQAGISEFLIASFVAAHVVLDLLVNVLDVRIEIKFAIEPNPTMAADVISDATVNGQMSLERVPVVELFLK